MTTTSGVGVSNQDVGGSMGDQSQLLQYHGGRAGDQQQLIDGFYINGVLSASQQALYMDVGSAQEVRYDLGSIAPEIVTGGVHVNFIPKEGGNRFTGTVYGTFSNHSFQSANITPDLQARGLSSANSSLDKVWDFNPDIGGPIMKDRLWFFFSNREWGTNNRVAAIWYNKDPLGNFYVPDFSRQGIEDTKIFSNGLRLTWQINSKNKLALYHLDQSGRCLCHRNINSQTAPEAATQALSPVMHLEEFHWTSPITSRLLLDAGGSIYIQTYSVQPEPDVWKPGVYAITELSTGLNYRITSGGHNGFQMHKFSPKVSLSYVTGSHTIKVGMDTQRGWARQWLNINGDLTFNFLNGVPRSFVMYTTPYNVFTNLDNALGIWGSYQSTLNRVTINAGLRFDYHHASDPAQHLPTVQFVGARDFPAVDDAPSWKDLDPRLGIAWDLFGNGKTAVKASINRYVGGEGTGPAGTLNPVNASVNSATRTWTDLNGDFLPQCDFLNPAANAECGPISNAKFGTLNIVTSYDNAILRGFGVRPDNWEGSVGVTHELTQGVSLDASYNYRFYGNFTVTQNTAVSPSDYSSYCITAPVDPRLPGGGGNQICGLYDVNPSKFGQVQNLITSAATFGKQTERYDGVDAVVSMRMPRGGRVGGGLNVGRTATNNCAVVEGAPNVNNATSLISVAADLAALPRTTAFCDVRTPWQPNARGYVVLPLPWALQSSTTLQTIPGPMIYATYAVPNAVIAPSLGRNLSAGANATANVGLVPPGTMYGDRLYQVDTRVTRMFRVGPSRRVQMNVDLYNLFNRSPVLLQNNTYGVAWQRPIAVLPGRLLKFGAQLDF
jgi:hypothetical protein